MKKSVKIILIGIFIFLTAVFFGYRYALTIGERDLNTEPVAFELNSTDWKKEFVSNADAATKKYLNKAVRVSGVVAGVEKNVLTLEDGVSCQFTNPVKMSKGNKITIKGRVTGYDDLLEEIKMDQCLIPSNN